MMRWALVIIVLLLAACSGEHRTYYQLPAMSIQTPTSGIISRQLWLEQIIVADYLSSTGLVYQLNDVKYVLANNHLWASPLEQQLQQTLISNLSNMMPGWLVTSQPVGQDQDVLNVTVNGFHWRYDGQVIISGIWLLKHQGRLIKQPFYVELKQDEDGYDGLVRTLAQGWQQQAQSIVTLIEKL